MGYENLTVRGSNSAHGFPPSFCVSSPVSCRVVSLSIVPAKATSQSHTHSLSHSLRIADPSRISDHPPNSHKRLRTTFSAVVHFVVIGLNIEPELWMTCVSLSNLDDFKVSVNAAVQLSESDPPPFQPCSLSLITTFFPSKILCSYHPNPILSALAGLNT